MKTKYILCNYLLLRDDFRIGLIISPMVAVLARSESARRFDNRKEKNRKILDWLINKGIIT
jgi:hypothetical protein